MRKSLVLIMAFFILFHISGCAKAVDLPDKGNSAGTTGGSVVSGTTAMGDTAGTAALTTTALSTSAWSTSTPEEQGINAEMLASADKRINENYPNVYSLLVVRHGYLVYEKYYQGMDETNANPVYSVTKSVMSALTGIALREKLIDNIDQKVSDFLPEYFSQIDDVKKKDITIENVLTMTGGLESVDTDFGSYYISDDWMRYAIDRPLTDDLGERFVYNTGLTHFLSGVITKISKMDTMDFANQYLFGPLGISAGSWLSDQKGYRGGGFGLSMKPADMARFGYLYLNKGKWNGEQIIPEEWVEESTKKHVTIDAERDYGYLFSLQTIQDKVHHKEYFTYRAQGSGGQIIMVVPELDMVVVVTASDWTTSNDESPTLDIIRDYIIPAVG